MQIFTHSRPVLYSLLLAGLVGGLIACRTPAPTPTPIPATAVPTASSTPTAVPTAPPTVTPSPTADAALPAWTVMVYADAQSMADMPAETSLPIGTTADSRLADFIVATAADAPANRYALLLYPPPAFTAAQLADELAAATGELGHPLDFVGFTTTPADQIERMTAIQPYVGTTAMPNHPPLSADWPLARWVDLLPSDPAGMARNAAATAAVQAADDAGIPTTAFDLSLFQAVSPTLKTFDRQIIANPSTSGILHTAAADHRLPAPYPAVNLLGLTADAARNRAVPAVADAAADLYTAVGNSIIAHTGTPAVTLPFPLPHRHPTAPAPYVSTGRQEVSAVLSTRIRPAPAADLHNGYPQQSASVLQPLHLAYTAVGRDAQPAAVLASAPDGRLLMYDHHTVADLNVPGTVVWVPTVPLLAVGDQTAPTVPWPLTDDVRIIPGRYRPLGDDADPVSAVLVLAAESPDPPILWLTADPYHPVPTAVQPNHAFQPDQYTYQAGTGVVGATPGQTLVLTPTADLRLTQRAAVDGVYTLSLLAPAPGVIATTALTVPVRNDALPSGTAMAALHPQWHYQFLHPADWQIRTEPRRLTARNPAGTIRLTVTAYPNAADLSPDELSDRILTGFGAVDLLYTSRPAVAQRPGRLHAYGYTAADGERTGLLVTLKREQVGYAIDLDGPTADEARLLELISLIVDSWAFRIPAPPTFTTWNVTTAGPLTITRPADFSYQATAGGWHRFTAPDDNRTFIAVRQDEETTAAAFERWLGVAADGVENFELGGEEQMVLGSRVWTKRPFTYVRDGQPISGAVWVADTAGRPTLTAWTEAPAAAAAVVENGRFVPLLIRLRR